MKRFQECNWVVKLWRYRHYVYIPFRFIWYIMKTTNKDMIDKNIWSILVGSAQCDMKWTYTLEEIREPYKTK